MKSTASARREAQQRAYKAMESYDPEEALKLCAKALEIDPRCVDALIMIAGAFDKIDERLYHLTRVVEIAEEDLGGEEFFKENKGHFWGILETRPYMRARANLAQTFYEAGMIIPAIGEYEGLLELNPNDNQGFRYLLIGLYLEIDDIDGVRRLLLEHKGDGAAVFAWSMLLERLISDDRVGADMMFADVRDTNPYFEGYLLGRKAMPVEMPSHYGLGDENEALICMDSIGVAWKKHPEAMQWLRQHTSSLVVSPKVGRNDPCPCGSGKKYKKCCFGQEGVQSVQITTGSRVAAEQMLQDVHQAMEGKQFSTLEEANVFLQEYNQQRNQQHVDDLQGLSSDQMHRFIHFPFDSPELVQFPSCVDTALAAPIMSLFHMMANGIGENGLKPTATGNLPRKLVQDAALAFVGKEMLRFGSIRSENDFSELYITRVTAELGGLVRKYKSKFILSRECRKILAEQGLAGIYPKLLHAYTREFSWDYRDGYPEIDFIQQSFLFTLYLFHRYGGEWHTNTFYEDAFLLAFPRTVKEVKPFFQNTQEETVRKCYSLRCLDRFAGFFGLAEIRREPGLLLDRNFELRKLPLLDEAVVFSL